MGIVLLILFIVMSFRIARTIIREAAIFEEFNQPKTLALLVMLFPIGPVALLLLPYRVGWLPAVIVAFACYLPAFIVSRRRLYAFERSGTDRTKHAHNAASQALGTSIVGFIYVAIFLVFSMINIGSS